MTLIETMKQALEVLEAHADIGIKSDKAITALRTAIAEAEKQEPVAFNRKAVWNVLFEVWNQNISASEGLQKLQDLYTTPPAAQRQWVGLTDEERDQFYKYVTMPDLVKAIEQALKEKNT